MRTTPPTIREIRQLREALGPAIHRTPVIRCAQLERIAPPDTRIHGKLEFLQRTGTFKARGALAVLMGLSDAQREQGVTAVSAGNHAIAVAYAAQVLGSNAKVVMTRSANAARINAARQLGAEIVLADDVHVAFEIAEQIKQEEGRHFVHPFEGREIAAGTGTVGLEICEQCDDFDALIVPVGGGGLIAGIANAVKQQRPRCRVIGVEPVGADSMHRSFAKGEPQSIDHVRTIADSLGAPYALPYSFGLCQQFVDQLVKVDDDALRAAMRLLFEQMKIAVEPACAASTAALLGPLRESLAGQRVMLLFCGSNIDWPGFESMLTSADRGEHAAG